MDITNAPPNHASSDYAASDVLITCWGVELMLSPVPKSYRYNNNAFYFNGRMAIVASMNKGFDTVFTKARTHGPLLPVVPFSHCVQKYNHHGHGLQNWYQHQDQIKSEKIEQPCFAIDIIKYTLPETNSSPLK